MVRLRARAAKSIAAVQSVPIDVLDDQCTPSLQGRTVEEQSLRWVKPRGMMEVRSDAGVCTLLVYCGW